MAIPIEGTMYCKLLKYRPSEERIDSAVTSVLKDDPDLSIFASVITDWMEERIKDSPGLTSTSFHILASVVSSQADVESINPLFRQNSLLLLTAIVTGSNNVTTRPADCSYHDPNISELSLVVCSLMRAFPEDADVMEAIRSSMWTSLYTGKSVYDRDVNTQYSQYVEGSEPLRMLHNLSTSIQKYSDPKTDVPAIVYDLLDTRSIDMFTTYLNELEPNLESHSEGLAIARDLVLHGQQTEDTSKVELLAKSLMAVATRIIGNENIVAGVDLVAGIACSEVPHEIVVAREQVRKYRLVKSIKQTLTILQTSPTARDVAITKLGEIAENDWEWILKRLQPMDTLALTQILDSVQIKTLPNLSIDRIIEALKLPGIIGNLANIDFSGLQILIRQALKDEAYQTDTSFSRYFEPALLAAHLLAAQGNYDGATTLIENIPEDIAAEIRNEIATRVRLNPIVKQINDCIARKEGIDVNKIIDLQLEELAKYDLSIVLDSLTCENRVMVLCILEESVLERYRNSESLHAKKFQEDLTNLFSNNHFLQGHMETLLSHISNNRLLHVLHAPLLDFNIIHAGSLGLELSNRLAATSDVTLDLEQRELLLQRLRTISEETESPWPYSLSLVIGRVINGLYQSRAELTGDAQAIVAGFRRIGDYQSLETLYPCTGSTQVDVAEMFVYFEKEGMWDRENHLRSYYKSHQKDKVLLISHILVNSTVPWDGHDVGFFIEHPSIVSTAAADSMKDQLHVLNILQKYLDDESICTIAQLNSIFSLLGEHIESLATRMESAGQTDRLRESLSLPNAVALWEIGHIQYIEAATRRAATTDDFKSAILEVLSDSSARDETTGRLLAEAIEALGIPGLSIIEKVHHDNWIIQTT